jgi:hypothetical protein
MKKISIIVCSAFALSCNTSHQKIEGHWQLADLKTAGDADSANITIPAMIALNIVPAFADITQDHIYFKDKNNLPLDSAQYSIQSDNSMQIVNGKDTSNGNWKMNNDELEIRFGKTSFKFKPKK